MEENQELRFVCKFCNKKYPCGKSLGGHMRTHGTSNSSESDENFEPNVIKISSLKDFSRFELGGQSGYGLRENPKKTWRLVNPKVNSKQDQICKQCGKGFQSLKALCGHMACHSETDRVLKDDHSWTSENDSDNEAEAPRRSKRAASMRYKRVVVRSSCFGSPVSEVDHEQEEVAMCLMMLSRDCGNWVGVNSVVAESSDNNSVVLETKSSSIDMRNIGGLNCVYNGDESVGIRKLGKGKLKPVDLENSDCGHFVNGAKKVDSDVSVYGFLTNDSFKKQKLEGGFRFKAFDSEFGTAFSKVKCRGADGLGKRSKYEFGGKKKKDLNCNGERRPKSKKSKGHECPICHRVFKSGQALGGHKRSHFLGASEEKINQTPIRKQEFSETQDLIDLNLPAPEEEEEANEHSQIMPW
ncbi:Zinc finger protein [Actinidia chinensis var. chinensis]|uniref:Zinc finger protein n=1 Tax=Actinidia chinensis var. chinensis TaxID=1590841 RepID=A0A2R6PCA5_ACTCC|nr:Zinc finger protein [Actinidia chinensis var. chinensis]